MTREQLIEEAAEALYLEYVDGEPIDPSFDNALSSADYPWATRREIIKNRFRRQASAVLAVFEKAQCARCGKIAEGYAFIGDDRYCHPDDGVDCYTLASHELTTLANQAFIEKAQAPTDHVKEAIYDGAEFVCVTCPRNSYGAQVAWEHAHPDEREVLSHLLNETDPEGGIDFEDENSNKQFWFPQADAILAAGFRRRERTPAEDEREALAMSEARAYADDADPSAREVTVDDFLTGWRTADRMRPAQTEPTGAQVIAARDELQRHGYARASLFAMRSALKAAFTAGQEANAAQLEAARHEGWKAARAEVRMIPSWYNSDTKQGGFDLQHGEVASEEGAWMEVMRVLNANPFTAGQEDGK